MRLLTSTLLAATVASSALVAGSGSAHAADDAYQYWGYYQVKDDAFTYASKGAGEFVPADGAIEGYRWSATPMNAMNTPRADLKTLTFDAICGEDEATSGEKRVAVIVDFGLDADAIGEDETPAPYADCAVVDAKATGLQTLEAVAKVRTETSSMGATICGIDGYPSTTCANGTTKTASAPDEVVEIAIEGDDAATDEKSEADSENSSTGLYIAGGVILALLALGAVVMTVVRRKKA